MTFAHAFERSSWSWSVPARVASSVGVTLRSLRISSGELTDTLTSNGWIASSAGNADGTSPTLSPEASETACSCVRLSV